MLIMIAISEFKNKYPITINNVGNRLFVEMDMQLVLDKNLSSVIVASIINNIYEDMKLNLKGFQKIEKRPFRIILG